MDLKTIVCILCERVTKSGTTVHNHQLCASCKSNFYRNYNRMFDFSMEKLRSSPQYLQNKPPHSVEKREKRGRIREIGFRGPNRSKTSESRFKNVFI